VLFNDLPEIDRFLDRQPAQGNRLEKFSESVQPLFEEMLLRVVDFHSLRDPDLVRTQFDENVSITPLSAQITPGSPPAIAEGGLTVEVFLDDPDPSDPLEPLQAASVGWIFEDATGTTFRVNSVHKLDDRGPVIRLFGTALPATEATEGVGFAGATLRPPALIQLLGNDYGVDIDQHEPAAYQRSAIRNVSQWLPLKGTVKAYDILGKISGYRATPLGLWRISNPAPAAIPAANVYELPIGSGKLYTDLDPDQPFFDEIPADTIPLDFFCFETPNWASEPVEPPASGTVPDGTTVHDAIALSLDVLGMTIVSTADLSDGRWSVRFTANSVGQPIDEQLLSVGYWYAEFPDGEFDDPVYLETTPVNVGGDDWEVEVYAGDAPVFGGIVDMVYDCHRVARCDWCRASVLRIEVIPTEVLTDPDALLAGVLTRLVQKMLQVVPIHVRLTDIIHILGPVQATMNITATAQAATIVTAAASVGYYYDIVPADVIEADTDHMIASATVFTVP
jgi:hypothetical protein